MRGNFGGAEVPLYAYRMQADSTEQLVGKLQMLSYTPQSKKLYIVQVNGAKMPTAIALQNTLNKIYAQALTSWQVQDLQINLVVNFPGGKMTHGGSNNFTTYNADQKTIIAAFEQSDLTFERDACYLFYIDNVQHKDKSIAGYMPLQRPIGFIYDNPNLNIVAHELAHGAFNLYHTFSNNQKVADQFTTENLMDYNGGTELWKHQWDAVHNPERVMFAWAQSEEEGAASLFPINPMYTKLFDLVYKYTLDGAPPMLSYFNAVNNAIDNKKGDASLSYSTEDSKRWSEFEKKWIDSWKLRAKDISKVLDETKAISAIKEAVPNSSIGKIVLQPKKIYFGSYQIGIENYTVALYGDGESHMFEKSFKKIIVKDIEDIADASKINYIEFSS